MTRKTEPLAFLSYVRSDDDHDSGQISELRRHLEGEIRIQTGRQFHIFQDRNDIQWGQHWKDRIESAILDVTFLIPVVTPSFLNSYACRSEFQTFLTREKAIGENRFILPIYYVSCDALETDKDTDDAVVSTIKARNWTDWRELRFEEMSSQIVRKKVAQLAAMVKQSMHELELVFAASSEFPKVESTTVIQVPTFSASEIEKQPSVDSPVQEEDPDRLARIRESYHIYTTEFDEVISPSELSEPADIMKLHSFLLEHVREQTGPYETELKAFNERILEFSKAGDTSISFLIDNSGSMRGQRITSVACWSSVVANALASAAIPCEVLGFTTRAWKGGRSRALWTTNGKPKKPGRLNDLRHVVYKSFDQTFQEADTNFGIMLREGLLKENIDGEALLWAISRINGCPTARKLLFVLSDGAPIDDSTLEANDSKFLHDHLVATASWIKATSGVELYGIGIDFDVSRYYGPSPATNTRMLGPDLLNVISFAIAGNWSKASAIKREVPKQPVIRSERKRRKVDRTDP